MAVTELEKTAKAEVICSKCGARYDRLPAFTCPRCGNPLCKTGCDGCAGVCAFRTSKRSDSPKPGGHEG